VSSLGSKILHRKIQKTKQKTIKKGSMPGADLQPVDYNLFSQVNFAEAAISNVKTMAFARLL